MVQRLALAKATVGQAGHSDAVVVAADTVVALSGETGPSLPRGANRCGEGCLVLGKPRDPEDAVHMLRLLRGRPHTVHSGLVAVWGERRVILSAQTTVWMREYSDAEIAAYVATGDPLDKAAAYAIQNNPFRLVERIDGCYANVMGLPLCHLYRAFRALGLPSAPPDRACQNALVIECPVAQSILTESLGYSN